MKVLLRSKRGLLISFSIILLAGAGGAYFYFNRDKPTESIGAVVNYTNREDSLKAEATTPEGKRSYINNLQGFERYEEAKKLAEELVNETKLATDAMLLLNICNKYITDGKDECVAFAQKVISEDVSNLDFFQAYSSAEVFEKNGNKSGAKKLYEHAYDIYPPQSQISELPIKSKEDLKKHIDSL